MAGVSDAPGCGHATQRSFNTYNVTDPGRTAFEPLARNAGARVP